MGRKKDLCKLGARTLFCVLVAVLTCSSQGFCQNTGPLKPSAKIPAQYKSPKTPAVDEALKRTFRDLDDARGQLQRLVDEGQMKRHLGIQGVWIASTKSVRGETNILYHAVFDSESGPILTFGRMLFLGDGHGRELPELRYDVHYYEDGNVKSFSRRGPGSLEFYPEGTPKSFTAELDERTSCQVSWDVSGKLDSEGTSSHAPRNEASLPEFTEMLRHGDNSKKWEAEIAMLRIGPASIPYALSVLKDTNPDSRSIAATLIGEFRDKGEPAAPELTRVLKEDSSATVRERAAITLGMIGPRAQSAVATLQEAASHDVTNVAQAAASAVKNIRR